MRNRTQFAKIIFIVTVFIVLLLIMLTASGAIEAAQGALLLCYKTVIPTLFPFFVLSAMLTGSGFSDILARVFSPLMRPLFRINGNGALPFVTGIVSGYPTGAKVTASLYENGSLSKEEGTHLLAFCNNSGPLFVIGAVGTGMLGSTSVGIYLYILHILSAVLVGISLRFFSCTPERRTVVTRKRQHTKSLVNLFTSAVSDSVSTILKICGYIVFFAVCTASLSPVLDKYLPLLASLCLKSILEVTNGVYLMSLMHLSPRILLTYISFLTGFGGICVLMQVAAVTEGAFPLKTYMLGKLLQGFYAAVLTYFSYPFFVQALAPVSISENAATTLVASCPPVLTVLPVLALFIYVSLRLKLRAGRMK